MLYRKQKNKKKKWSPIIILPIVHQIVETKAWCKYNRSIDAKQQSRNEVFLIRRTEVTNYSNARIIIEKVKFQETSGMRMHSMVFFFATYTVRIYDYKIVSDISLASSGDDDCRYGDRCQADGQNKKKQRRNTTIMHVHVGRKKRHAVQPSVRCCLPANGTSPKYSSTLSVDMLLSDRDTLDNDPLLASREPLAGNCNKSSSVSVSMSRDRRLYTCTISKTWVCIYIYIYGFRLFLFSPLMVWFLDVMYVYGYYGCNLLDFDTISF